MSLPSILGFQAVKPQVAIGRNNLIFDKDFSGVVQTTTEAPFTAGMPTNGWNTRVGDYLRDWQNWQSGTNYAIRQETTIVKPGSSTSCKYELHSTDPEVSGSVRTELQIVNYINGGVAETQECERWYGLSYYLKDWLVDDFGDSILQWHDGSGPAPPLSLQTYDNGSGVQHLYLKRAVDETKSGSSYNTYEHDLGAITSNVWFEIVLHVKWAYTNPTGLIQCWKNGSKLVDVSGKMTNSIGGSYSKWGMNKFNWGPSNNPPLSSNITQRIFFIDHVRIANEFGVYNDVAPTQI